ncbi:MAG: DUF378 domain-containing protein [Nanoarchaeota archaeon]|nr:DUF378 domain-containing protein [Nanoarchaeota archaeon]
MSTLDWVGYVLLVVGGLNWGLVGFFDFNLVESLFGAGTLTSIIYDLVGLSALWSIWGMAKM